MKGSKEKEHRISNLKDMIDNINEDEETDFDEIEEDPELIDYLNESTRGYDELEIDDEFIYHPDDEYDNAVNLDEDPIDDDYIIKAPDVNDSENEYDDIDEDIVGDISENFDNVINAKIKGRPILAIFSSIIGVILIIISIFIFESRSDRIIDNVVAGESSFMFIIFLVAGLFLLLYGIFKLFNVKNPFEKITSDINTIDSEKKETKDTDNTQKEEPSQKPLPKSKIPLDKDSYKIGEFDMDELKTSLKKPATSNKNQVSSEDIDNIPRTKEKEVEKKVLTAEEFKEIDYEHAQLESESIDEIFAEVEDIEEVPIISLDSKERNE